MKQNFNEFVDNLQKEIIKKEIKDHNKKIVDLFHNPYHFGKLPEDEITIVKEQKGGPKAYYLRLHLKIENDLITKAFYETDGCGVMIATGSQLILLIEGKSIEFAEKLKHKELNEALMGVPYDEIHCIDLAIDTLRSLIEKYKQK